MKIDQNLSSLHAYLCADGYVIKNPVYQKQKYYHIGLRNTNIVLLKDFQKKFYGVFRLKPYLCVDGRCRIQSKKIYNMITKRFGSFYSNNWKLPKLSKKNLRFWLRSYFDCESWITNKERQSRYIGMDSINKKGIVQVQNALSRFNIKSTIKKRNKRKIFTLHIYSKSNLMRFQKQINFLHPNKKEKLEKAINSYIDYNWYINNLNFKKIFKEKAKLRRDNNVIRLCSILRTNLKQIKNLLSKLKIKSNIYQRTNGFGRKYYEMSIYRKENINKLIDLDLINGGINEGENKESR